MEKSKVGKHIKWPLHASESWRSGKVAENQTAGNLIKLLSNENFTLNFIEIARVFYFQEPDMGLFRKDIRAD